jgi:hypothetical protein
MVEPSEVADAIREEREAPGARVEEKFRRFTAVYLGIVAALLAITMLGGSHATKVMLNANIQASDIYGYYQAKYMRQTAYRLFADQLEAQLAAQPDLPEAAKAKTVAAIKRWREQAARYESDPASGTGKQELLAQAKAWEAKRNHATAQDPNFEFAEALYQIAIVLGSVAIVAASRALVNFSGTLAILATLLMINGYFLIVQLPLE